ncbi:hypothetical protein DPM19_34010 [Actinomadura craniellae]|uniref:Uncharacterized protein n=1 Tax=Actinomadura craniellae TaxID=2231787 RepID=A0A365GXM2_9ACTN|nr:AAA family ATPase [Actinomadura craniellae]RAY10673.1 hypothetical protein DPM19_34010 [Actinomadura craniellae]
MHLKNYTVMGFRSLQNVRDIPVGSPTILAGHNDGGKSAALSALQFLVADYKLSEVDRTYESPAEGSKEQSQPRRCELTAVEGIFTLDPWEQSHFGLPETVLIRRQAGEELIGRLEYWARLPDDERLQDLSRFLVPELKTIVKELGVSTASSKRADLEAALRTYGIEHSSSMGWVQIPSELEKRMPRVLPFDGKAAKPDQAVKVALKERFESHVDDNQISGQLQELESEVKERLRIDAKSLCDHIHARCPDLTEVFVEPDVAFDYGFRGAPLKIARNSGEAVGLDRSGLGSNRRISLAIWEWMSELLEQESRTAPETTDDNATNEGPPPLQTIILYDEPDTHLDYKHQRTIMQLIRDQAALPNVNVVVATHSMNLIDGVDISDVVHLKLENGRTTIERLGSDTHHSIDLHLKQIAASLGLRNSVLLHERCFLAVEGDTEQQAIPILFRLSEGMSLQAAGIALWACFNNEGALHLASYLVKHGRSVMLMVDADSRTAAKGLFKVDRLIRFFGSREAVNKMVKFVGEPQQFNELEELFSNELWAKIANEIWPKSDPWLPSDFAELRNSRKFSTSVQLTLRDKSDVGPGGKPEMMYQLACALKRPEDVPTQLREVFAELRQAAE